METVNRIVVTGPESTGKTKIASYLADRFNCTWIPEYARYYIENLQSKYDYADIEAIARKQVQDYKSYSSGGIIIFDTWLIITKIWFREVYHKYPEWLQESIDTLKIDLYLLCSPDLAWESEPVRESGGKEKREKLYRAYETEIIKTGVPYGIIQGTGRLRYKNAEKIVLKQFNLKE